VANQGQGEMIYGPVQASEKWGQEGFNSSVMILEKDNFIVL
jgi:hypothetical protein